MKILLKVLGLLSLGLGAVGVVLPLLPTTPFLLFAAFCFARSSERLHHYLYEHSIFGGYLQRYESGALTLSDKIRTLAILWIGLSFSAYMSGKPVVAVILGVIGIVVSVHLLLLGKKHKRESDTSASSEQVQKEYSQLNAQR